MSAPEYCPNCGEPVPPGAAACPACGADEQTGWSDRATGQRLGVPEDEFDYEEFVRNEFGDGREDRVRPRGVSWFWWVVAVLVAGAFILMYVRF